MNQLVVDRLDLVLSIRRTARGSMPTAMVMQPRSTAGLTDKAAAQRDDDDALRDTRLPDHLRPIPIPSIPPPLPGDPYPLDPVLAGGVQ